MEDLATLGQSPIRDDSPTGESIRYDPDFDLVKAEIEKLDSVSADDPNWPEVLKLCQGILENKSKDLLIAGYFVAALWQESGYAGLRDGLAIVTGMLKTYWEDCFPEARRMRGRIGAMQWLMERVTPWVDKATPSAGDAEAVKACQEHFPEFFDAVRERFENDSPGMGDMRRAIEKAVADLPREQPPEEARPAASPAAPAGAAAPAAAPAAAMETPQDATKAVKGLGQTLRIAATVLRKTNPLDPVPYRLIRFASWATLTMIPPNQAGQTQIPAPRQEVLSAAQNLVQTGDWANLLELGEGRTGDTPFWLDASRYTATALASLGPGHEQAREVVMVELAALLKRLPDLLNLSFQGGEVPFADGQTKLWIESEVSAALGGGEGGGTMVSAVGGEGGEDGVAGAVKEGRKLLAGGKFPEAMALFQRGASAATCQRDRFRWKLALARACQDSGQVELAMHQLESLDRESDEFGLDEWEPSLSKDVVALLYQCQKKLLAGKKAAPDAVEAAGRTYARLCRLDPVAAMEMK